MTGQEIGNTVTLKNTFRNMSKKILFYSVQWFTRRSELKKTKLTDDDRRTGRGYIFRKGLHRNVATNGSF